MILRVKATGVTKMDFLSMTILDSRRLTIFLSVLLSFWCLTLGLWAHATSMWIQEDNAHLIGWIVVARTTRAILIFMEAVTVIGYLLVFYYLFRELKGLLTHQRY